MTQNPALTIKSATEATTQIEQLINRLAKPGARLSDLINAVANKILSISNGVEISCYSDHQNGLSVLRFGKKPSKEESAKQVFSVPVEWNEWAEEKGIGNKVLVTRFIVRGEIEEESILFLESLLGHTEKLNIGIIRKPIVPFWGNRDSTQVKWGIVASGDKSLKLLSEIELFAGARQPVLITGETGCGKELVANALHKASTRKGRFFAVNCAAIPKELIESELFGHKKGAYTGAGESREGYFQAANEGTLFLDEIGELSLDLQAKLLRVLQENKVRRVGSNIEEDVKIRVVAATNRNLEEMVKNGEFRADLFYRLNCLTLNVAPLRERIEEIPNLVEFLLKKISEESGQEITIQDLALNRLMLHDFPGNVRELVNVLEAGSVFARDGVIELQHLRINGEFEELVSTPDEQSEELTSESLSQSSDQKGGVNVEENLIKMFWGKSYQDMEQEMKRVMFSYALNQHDGHINRAAESLGIERTMFSRHAKKLGLLKKDEQEVMSRLNLNLNLGSGRSSKEAFAA